VTCVVPPRRTTGTADCHGERLAFLKVDRPWDELRNDPRFVAIAQAMHLK